MGAFPDEISERGWCTCDLGGEADGALFAGFGCPAALRPLLLLLLLPPPLPPPSPRSPPPLKYGARRGTPKSFLLLLRQSVCIQLRSGGTRRQQASEQLRSR